MPIFNFVQVGQSKCSGAGYISADLFFVKTYYRHPCNLDRHDIVREG
jgi:hypothetical protein